MSEACESPVRYTARRVGYHPQLAAGITARPPAARVCGIDLEIAARCAEPTGRLATARRSQTASSATR